MATKLKRVSVAIDNETNNILEELANKENKTISEIIREAIGLYSKLGDDEENMIDINKIKAYDELLRGREHIILDLEVWIAVLDELNEKASEEF
ncbi:CopG family transcriptional regulator, partial [Archaeoglobales archaeon]